MKTQLQQKGLRTHVHVSICMIIHHSDYRALYTVYMLYTYSTRACNVVSVLVETCTCTCIGNTCICTCSNDGVFVHVVTMEYL